MLVDTSAWVEFLRDTGSPVCAEVDRLLGSDFAITDPVLMEVLAGARDFDDAAQLFRVCRRGGRTVRRLIDCLIAAIAIREGVPILHADSDFTVLARYTRLREHAPR